MTNSYAVSLQIFTTLIGAWIVILNIFVNTIKNALSWKTQNTVYNDSGVTVTQRGYVENNIDLPDVYCV